MIPKAKQKDDFWAKWGVVFLLLLLPVLAVGVWLGPYFMAGWAMGVSQEPESSVEIVKTVPDPSIPYTKMSVGASIQEIVGLQPDTNYAINTELVSDKGAVESWGLRTQYTDEKGVLTMDLPKSEEFPGVYQVRYRVYHEGNLVLTH